MARATLFPALPLQLSPSTLPSQPQTKDQPSIHLACLDPSLAFRRLRQAQMVPHFYVFGELRAAK